MHICYIDESGDSQPIKTPNDNIQPLLVICGIFIDSAAVKGLTNDFIALKRRFYPAYFAKVQHALNVLLTEIKGSDIRTDIRDNATNSGKVAHHFRFLDAALALLKKHNARLVARVWIKQLGIPLVDNSIYTLTTQNIVTRFQKYLEQTNSNGIVVADFRDPNRNSYVSHSIFTQKYKQGGNGDAYPCVNETATFGISNNHACLQIADLICSALLAPMAGRTLCHPGLSNVHTHPHYEAVRQRYARRLKALQFHCKVNGQMYWGISASANPYNGKGIQDLLK